jgi:hypothetical protein
MKRLVDSEVVLKWVHDHAGYDRDDCLTWPFGLANGRGRFMYLGKNVSACRFLCELVHGPAPSPDHETAHSLALP